MDKPLIPALHSATKYTSNLSARSALYSDFYLLIHDLNEPFLPKDYQAFIIVENRLTRASGSARRKLWEELHKRYILDSSHPLFAAFWSEWIRAKPEAERALTAYVLFALKDPLVCDLGTNWLFPYLRLAPSEIRVEEVLNFIQQSSSSHPEVAAWSAETIKRVAQHYMASVRDFGLARGKGRKLTVRPSLHAAPIRLLIKALRLTGTKDIDVVRSPIFRLLSLDSSEVINALSELNQRGELHFKMQADVIELDLGATR